MDIIEVTELLNQYVKEKPLSNDTIRTYTGVVNVFINDTQIQLLDEVTFNRLLDWRLLVISRASDITWNNYLRHMRALWNFAIKKGCIPEDFNPFSDLNWGKYKKRAKKTIQNNDLKRLIAYLTFDDCPFEPCWFWALVVRFLYQTGVRRSELVGIKWSDLDIKNKLVYVTEDSDKTDQGRLIPLQDSLVDSILQYRTQLLHEYPGVYSKDGQMFNVTKLNSRYRSSSGLMSVAQLSGFFKRLGAKLDIRVSSHRFRHSMATEIAAKNVGDIKPLQEILGHADVRTTLESYVHPDLESLKMVVNGLSKI